MTRPYAIYQRTRYLMDAPLITIIFLLLYNYFPSGILVTSDAYIILFIIFSILAWYSVAQLSGLYRDLRSNKFSEEIIYIIITGLLFAVVSTSFLFFVRWDIQFDNLFIILYFASIFTSVVCTKYILRKYIHRIFFSKKLQEHVLLVGATAAAKNFYDTINSNYYYGYHCLGFIDNEEAKLNGATYFGNLDQLENIFTHHHVDEVIIALPNSQHQQIRTTLETCDFHGKRVRIIPDFYTYATSNIQINNIGLLPVINLRSLPLDTWGNKILKRTFDVCFSIAFFVALGWWIMPLIALAIRFTSKGPVIFKQERWGLNNEKIICYKFRTMYNGAPETDEHGNFLQASPKDSRVTPLGKFLRKNNLDEYPQFWNVLLGNMSVVGPRPHVTPLNLAAIESVHRYMHRHLVKPGITGWAQVNGARGETTAPEAMQKRVNLDLYYIHKWTFWMDCQIILESVINILKGDQKAY